MDNGEFNREIRYEIVECLGVIATHSTGWRKELNLVSWNGREAKFDIRDWSPDHEHMSRGVTLHKKEARHTAQLILAYFDGEDEDGFKAEQEGNIEK